MAPRALALAGAGGCVDAAGKAATVHYTHKYGKKFTSGDCLEWCRSLSGSTGCEYRAQAKQDAACAVFDTAAVAKASRRRHAQ